MASRLRQMQARAAALIEVLKVHNEKCPPDDQPDERTAWQAIYDKDKAELSAISSDMDREKELMEYERRLGGADFGNQEPPGNRKQREGGNQGFGSFGEFLQAIAHAASPRGFVDPRLRPEAATGQSEGVGSEGGFLVGTDYATDLVLNVYSQGEILNRVRKIPISSNSNSLTINTVKEANRATGSRWGGIRAYWKTEAAQKTASTTSFRQTKLELRKLVGLCYATDELLEDAAALEAVITSAFTEEFRFQLEDAVVNGDGLGKPLGVLNADCLVSQAKETGQAAATIVAENVEKMYSRALARGITNSIWLINQSCWPQIFQLNHTVGTGGVPMFIPAGGLTAAPNGMLLGRPIVPVEYCAALGTAGDIILADFSQYLMIDKGGIQTASSIHLKFDYDETCFRFVYRCDGRPAWDAALTPYKDTGKTQSPFVALAVRA